MTANPSPDSLARARRLVDDMCLLLTGKSQLEMLDEAERREVWNGLAEMYAQAQSENRLIEAMLADVAECRHTHGCGIQVDHYPNGRPNLDTAWPLHFCNRPRHLRSIP